MDGLSSVFDRTTLGTLTHRSPKWLGPKPLYEHHLQGQIIEFS